MNTMITKPITAIQQQEKRTTISVSGPAANKETQIQMELSRGCGWGSIIGAMALAPAIHINPSCQHQTHNPNHHPKHHPKNLPIQPSQSSLPVNHPTHTPNQPAHSTLQISPSKKPSRTSNSAIQINTRSPSQSKITITIHYQPAL